MELARRWPRTAGVLARRQSVRGRAAPWNRHRGGRRTRGARTRGRRGHVCRFGSDARPHGHHRDLRRPQGVPHPSRPATREARNEDRRRKSGRRAWAVRRTRARPAVRASRRSRGRERDVCRPAEPSASSQRSRSCAGAGAFAPRPGACPLRRLPPPLLLRRRQLPLRENPLLPTEAASTSAPPPTTEATSSPSADDGLRSSSRGGGAGQHVGGRWRAWTRPSARLLRAHPFPGERRCSRGGGFRELQRSRGAARTARCFSNAGGGARHPASRHRRRAWANVREVAPATVRASGSRAVFGAVEWASWGAAPAPSRGRALRGSRVPRG